MVTDSKWGKRQNRTNVDKINFLQKKNSNLDFDIIDVVKYNINAV